MDHKTFYRQLLSEASASAGIDPEIILYSLNPSIGVYNFRVNPNHNWYRQLRVIFVGESVFLWGDRTLIDNAFEPIVVKLSDPDALERIVSFLEDFKD